MVPKDELLQAALNAVNELFSDTSVPLEISLDRMEQVLEDVETGIQLLKADLLDQ